MSNATLALITGLITGAVTLAVAGLGILGASRRLQGELHLQEERLKRELRTEFMAETAIRHLLDHPEWKQRSFHTVKLKMGDAFSDQELRKLLVRSGAVCFWKTLEGGEQEEFWGLIDRNRDRLSRPATGPAESDAD